VLLWSKRLVARYRRVVQESFDLEDTRSLRSTASELAEYVYERLSQCD
jgi:hypothetical protein